MYYGTQTIVFLTNSQQRYSKVNLDIQYRNLKNHLKGNLFIFDIWLKKNKTHEADVYEKVLFC